MLIPPSTTQFVDEASLEFLELFNHTDSVINISGYTFASGLDFTFPENTLSFGLSLKAMGKHITSDMGIPAVQGWQ